MYIIRFLIIFVVYLNYGSCDCFNYKTCSECVGRAYYEKCVWCASKEVPRDGIRCKPINQAETNKTWCEKKYRKYPKTNPLPVQIEKEELNSGESGSKIIRLQPTLVNITAFPGVPVNFNITYQSFNDSALDVYYLIDNTYTMKKHKETLKKQAWEIYEELRKFTSNIHLGIGSFVEKPALPFADISVYKKIYTFRNHLKLSDDKVFASKIEDIWNDEKMETVGNYDDAEDGFDALMQTMVCNKDIGWKQDNNSRRIIVYCTDNTYHSMGDGKMVGAYVPHDMKCHLENNEYNSNYSLYYDYPSVGQINKVSTESKFNIIFAAPESVSDVYVALKTRIEGARYAVLTENNDGSNIVDLIKHEYLKLTRSLKIRSVPSILKLKPDCTKEDECKLKHREVFNISAILTVALCEDVKTFEIEILGTNEKIIVNVDVDCKCDCAPAEKKSAHCNGGTYECGICKDCVDHRYGDKCQYKCTDKDSNALPDLQKCKGDGQITCSGRGKCNCSHCECNPGFSGEFCEFDDHSCPRSSEGLLCSGQGVCHTGRCHCSNPDMWEGDDCSCIKGDSMCIPPYSNNPCFANGKCVCGRCKCSANFLGAYCDICVGCEEKRCKELEDLAQCIYDKPPWTCVKLFNETISTSAKIIGSKINKTEMNSDRLNTASRCTKYLDDGKVIVFKYKYGTNEPGLHLYVQNESEAPDRTMVLVAVGSTVGVILFIGLLTLVGWKILVDLYDEREYNRFVKESQEAGFDVSLNPLYQDPVLQFMNPTFDACVH